MDEIPFPVDAAIDVRHANGHRRGSIGIDSCFAAFEADRVSEVHAFKQNDVIRD